MSFEELLSAVRAFSRVEQVRLMHTLVDDLTRPDLPSDDVIAGALFMDAIHGGSGGYEMAAEMMRLLEEDKKKQV